MGLPSIWDLILEAQVLDVRARPISAESGVERLESHARWREADARDRIARLMRVIEAMWELTSEKTGVTTTQLVERLRAIDARDGHADGKAGPAADVPLLSCAHCGAGIPAGRSVCQFCGTEAPGAKADPFRL